MLTLTRNSAEYIYSDKGIIHVLHTKPSNNVKLGFGIMIHTYHFSAEQVFSNDFNQDANNCLDCPMSKTNNGGCYTHKGTQLLGLKSKLRKLHRNNDKIGYFNQKNFVRFVERTMQLSPTLCRLGIYGEAVLLGENIVSQLVKLAPKHTAYTHQWHKDEYRWTAKYFMSSVHNNFEVNIAKDLGFRSFLSTTEANNGSYTTCLAAKESLVDVKCSACGLCNGSYKSSKIKSIHIITH